MWCDDNYGYITHFPTAEEAARPGGMAFTIMCLIGASARLSVAFYGESLLALSADEAGIRKRYPSDVDSECRGY